jgi:hypothetical protein
MRLLLFTLLISTSLYAQMDTGDGSLGPCTRATFSGGGTYNCASLDISAGAAVTFGNGAAPVIIKVQGNVTLNAALSVAGIAGNPDLDINGANQSGGLNGPGATPGGGVLAGSFAPQNGTDHVLATDSNGKAGGNGLCGGGGGGGAFAIVGDPGSDCSSPGPGGLGGNIFYSDIPSPLVGGLGGGSGGDGLAGFYGAGGGGGGALLIMAGGNIIINGNISARGGNGGTSAANAGQGGGGGGGGSGGVVAIKSSGQITNNGAIDADGGTGGAAANNGDGGDGGHGFVLLEDADGIIDGIGTIPPLYGETGTSISQRQKSSKVTSDISCGMIKPNEDSNSALMQIVLGFMLAIGFGFLSKKSLKLFA